MPVKQIGETDTQSRDLATGAWVFGLSNGAGGQTVSDGPTLVRAKITFSATSSVYEVTVRTNSGGAYATYFEEFTSGSPEVYILTNEVLIEDEDVFNVYIRSQSGSDTAVSVTAKLYDVCAFMSATDGKALISTDAQDLSGTLDVNTKTVTNNAITAAAIAAAAIDNATFAADIGSTPYATNIIALAVRNVLDELNLDHLMKVVATTGIPEVVDNTVLAKIMTDDGDTSAFSQTTDSLEAIGTDVAADEGHSTKVDYHSTQLG